MGQLAGVQSHRHTCVCCCFVFIFSFIFISSFVCFYVLFYVCFIPWNFQALNNLMLGLQSCRRTCMCCWWRGYRAYRVAGTRACAVGGTALAGSAPVAVHGALEGVEGGDEAALPVAVAAVHAHKPGPCSARQLGCVCFFPFMVFRMNVPSTFARYGHNTISCKPGP